MKHNTPLGGINIDIEIKNGNVLDKGSDICFFDIISIILWRNFCHPFIGKLFYNTVV